MENNAPSLLVRAWWAIEDLIDSLFDFIGGLLMVSVVMAVVGAIPYGLIWLFFHFISVDMDHQLAIQIAGTTMAGHFLVWWKHMRDPGDNPPEKKIQRHYDGRIVLNTGAVNKPAHQTKDGLTIQPM